MLIKTDKGRQELRPGTRTLGQRERALLLVADGSQSESRLGELFGGEGARLIGRIDVKADRDGDRLAVRAFWAEDGVKMTPGRLSRLESELARLRKYLQPEVVIVVGGRTS